MIFNEEKDMIQHVGSQFFANRPADELAFMTPAFFVALSERLIQTCTYDTNNNEKLWPAWIAMVAMVRKLHGPVN